MLGAPEDIGGPAAARGLGGAPETAAQKVATSLPGLAVSRQRLRNVGMGRR